MWKNLEKFTYVLGPGSPEVGVLNFVPHCREILGSKAVAVFRECVRQSFRKRGGREVEVTWNICWLANLPGMVNMQAEVPNPN